MQHQPIRSKGAAVGAMDEAVQTEARRATFEEIPVASLTRNDWNPNEMTSEQKLELAAEIRRLGRVPKPIVVREVGGERYEIVDGEQTWLLAVEHVGLENVTCEVIAADEFEAMRQTYKRNLHGTMDAVKLGRLFRRMKEHRGFSNVELAEEIEVSEGTIRNYLLYADAADARNGYEHERLISGMHVRDVRDYVSLPDDERDLWLANGRRSAPSAFAIIPKNVDVEFRCPSCGYEWSGGRAA